MARRTASAKWAEGPALDGRRDTPLGLSLSEGLGSAWAGRMHATVGGRRRLSAQPHACSRSTGFDGEPDEPATGCCPPAFEQHSNAPRMQLAWRRFCECMLRNVFVLRRVVQLLVTCCLTFELSRHRRETAGPARLRIDRTDSPARQFAVGARFQRMVRPGVEKQA